MNNLTIMAKYWSTNHEHNYDWDTVASKYWNKYPNPHSSHVFSEDILSAEVNAQGQLRVKRLLSKTNKLPSWGEHLFKTRDVRLIEEIIVDPKTKTFTTYNRNLNLRFFMGTTEKVTYTPKYDDDGQECKTTNSLKEVWIESEFYGLRSAIKKFGLDRFKKNCVKATEGFNWVLNRTNIT